MTNPFKQYSDRFSEYGFWKTLNRYARKVGLKAVYSALLMFYAYRQPETPYWAKRIIIGTLGYLLSPIDAIPDLSPLIGYTDDVGVLSFGLVTVAAYINDKVRGQAREKIKKWFGDGEQKELEEVDQVL
ncbi:MAG: DUF1232 domain-containing protein [Saprospiraceae bacterium]|nr:DUF1232 domain-containing protein [Saprospiraceae bacterium]